MQTSDTATETLERLAPGIPTWSLFLMEHAHIERLAGAAQGDYIASPTRVYLQMQRAAGCRLMDQFIPENPLTMGTHGFEQVAPGPSTGQRMIVVDGQPIESSDDVAAHLEQFVFPWLRSQIDSFDTGARARKIVQTEQELQQTIGQGILKIPYGCASFPHLAYSTYGYEHYFAAYALHPDIIEKHFALQADLALLNNEAAAIAISSASLAPLIRLDHDMADSRGTLVSLRSLERNWFPHFARCLEPFHRAGIRLIWHCDGNLMQMIPPLLQAGISGFQGFQYECGMDYRAICRMKDRNGRAPIIFAGVSVTTTLPHGSPADVRDELRWLVDNGPQQGLVLGASSSVTPGVPWENIASLVDGLAHYRTSGR